jgi:hypothetical protein
LREHKCDSLAYAILSLEASQVSRMGVRSRVGLGTLAMEGRMADHTDAPIIAQDLGAFFTFNDIPGVFASSWSKQFNGFDATREAPGFELPWVFRFEPTPTSSLQDTLDANAPVVPSGAVPDTFDLSL